MQVLILGASRNIGLLSALRLLGKSLCNSSGMSCALTKQCPDQGNTVTLFVRSQETFKDNEEVQKFIASGTARVEVGDALKEVDVRRVLTIRSYDLIISTLGGSASAQCYTNSSVDATDILSHLSQAQSSSCLSLSQSSLQISAATQCAYYLESCALCPKKSDPRSSLQFRRAGSDGRVTMCSLMS